MRQSYLDASLFPITKLPAISKIPWKLFGNLLCNPNSGSRLSCFRLCPDGGHTLTLQSCGVFQFMSQHVIEFFTFFHIECENTCFPPPFSFWCIEVCTDLWRRTFDCIKIDRGYLPCLAFGAMAGSGYTPLKSLTFVMLRVHSVMSQDEICCLTGCMKTHGST